MHCLQCPVVQDTPGVPGPSWDQRHAKAVELLQREKKKNSSVNNREQSLFSRRISSWATYFKKTMIHSDVNPRHSANSYFILMFTLHTMLLLEFHYSFLFLPSFHFPSLFLSFLPLVLLFFLPIYVGGYAGPTFWLALIVTLAQPRVV